MLDDRDHFRDVFQRASASLSAVDDNYLRAIERGTDLLLEALTTRQSVFVFGNGGSAADAQHIAAELVGRFARVREPYRVMALSTNNALLTAWSNDEGYEGAFARELRAFGHEGDVAWGISTSGNSPNVIEALRTARQRGLRTLGLTGPTGGEMRQYCDVLIPAPATDTPRIQELHVVTYHAICARIEERMAARR